MIILGIDTSSKAASVALYKDGLILGECMYNHGKTHSVYIMPMIKSMLEASEVKCEDIDCFACGVGPGSFTGVRIGITMTKTFALVEDKPCVGVDSLYAAAFSSCGKDKLVIAVEDARRDRVFACGVLNGKIVIDTNVFGLEELYDRVSAYNNDVLFVGGGTRVYKDSILQAGFPLDENKLITGRDIIKAAQPIIYEGKFDTSVSLMPKYLLKSQAERQKA